MKEITISLSDETVARLTELKSVINFLSRKKDELEIEDLIKVALYHFLPKYFPYTSLDDKKHLTDLCRLGLEYKYPLRHRIKEIMELEGVSFATMCTQLDIPKSTLSNILNEKTQLSLETFLRIYAFLGAPQLTHILYRDEPDGKAVQNFDDVSFGIME